MGCKCGHGKATKLNNLDSLDHLKLAFEVEKNTLNNKELDQYDDFDIQEIFSVYNQLFPNQRIKPTLDQAVGQLRIASERYSQSSR
jgi:hypothetical protein